ncbi:MAG: DUF937 domain-containing protein [Planctomycetota bacterium]|nr:DUF937 domain-containing protein [Planctomycetota bacterium]
MNLVDLIKSQLTPDVLGKLAGQVGANESQAKSVIGAAVPALLSALAGSASQAGGMQKLLSALGGLGSMSDMLSGASLEKGTGLLTSLLGGSTLSGIVSTLAKFSGLGGDSTSKLLGYLMPMVLGGVMSSFKGKTPDAAGLLSLFSENKSAIASAIPSGLSLASIPGLSNTSEAVRSAAGTAGRNVGRAAETVSDAASPLKFLLPVLALAGVLGGLWWFLNQAPAVKAPEIKVPAVQVPAVPVPKLPEVTLPSTPALPAEAVKLTSDLSGWFTSLSDSLGGIKDVATAEAALPKLKDAASQLDSVKSVFDKLPAAGKSSVLSLITSNLGAIKDLIAKVASIPGVGDLVKPFTDPILTTLTALGS